MTTNTPPVLTRRSTAAILACVVATLALTALDIGTKTWAEESLSRARMGEAPPVCQEEDGYIAYQRIRGDAHVVIEDVFEFEYAENCGAAFGLLRTAPVAARRGVFGLAATAAVITLLFLFAQGRGGSLFAWSVPFVASGALGNLIDRIRYGYVVDFIHVHYEPWSFDYPTFNVADITITVGVVLLVLDSFRPEPAASTAATRTEADASSSATASADADAAPDASTEGDASAEASSDANGSTESPGHEPGHEPGDANGQASERA